MQNGDISLYFGKEGGGDVTPPDEPTDDDDEIRGDIVWSDDFEVTSHFQAQKWTVEEISGNGIWRIKPYSTTPSEKEPPLLSGSMYMAMESNEASSMMGYKTHYSCRTVSNDIQLVAGDYVLTGKYGGYATQKLSNDTLYIELFLKNTGTWVTVKSLRITKRSQWESFSLPINCSADAIMRLAFTGSADKQSVLFLDNLKLYRSSTDDIENVMASYGDTTHFYSIDGRYVGHSISNTEGLPSGIYIMRQGKQTRKMVVR